MGSPSKHLQKAKMTFPSTALEDGAGKDQRAGQKEAFLPWAQPAALT